MDADDFDFVTTTEALKILRRKSRTTIWRLVRDGELTGYRVGSKGLWLFKRADVEALLVPSRSPDASDPDLSPGRSEENRDAGVANSPGS